MFYLLTISFANIIPEELALIMVFHLNIKQIFQGLKEIDGEFMVLEDNLRCFNMLDFFMFKIKVSQSPISKQIISHDQLFCTR